MNAVVIFNFGLFLPFYPPNSPKNQNLKAMKKTPADIIILHMCTKNYGQMMYGALIWCATDRWTGGWKKWHIEVGAPPKNNISSFRINKEALATVEQYED